MRRALCVLILMSFGAFGLHAGEAEPSTEDDAELGRILSRLDEVARRYRDEALRFSCEEKVIYARPGKTSLFFSFEYIYEFSESAGLLDYRVDTRSSHRGDKTPPRARLSEYNLPYYLTRGYSWVFLFDQAHQPRHRYSLGKQTVMMGRRALPISFAPVPPIENDFNDWFGTLWIDSVSLLPLRVEAIKSIEREKEQAFQAALVSTEPIRGDAKNGWIFARVSTDFTHEVNSMRFPGKTIATGTQARVRIRKGRRVPDEQPLFSVTQIYTGYRFFGVKLKEVIH